MSGERKVVLCLKCNGTGLVSHPPHIAGDQPTFSSDSAGPWTCAMCSGIGMIHGLRATTETHTDKGEGSHE